MLSLHGVTYQADGALLLSGVDLTAATGALTAIVGPNGAGKTTVLRIAAGDLKPTDGRVELDDRPIAGLGVKQLALLRAVLPHGSSLVFPFSVRDIVRMGRHPHRFADAGSDERAVTDAMSAMDIARLGDRSSTTLSAGEQQRVQLARVLAQETRTLLLDEPTSALDVAHQHRVMEAIVARARTGVAVLAVLHDPNLASRYADEVILLDDGEIRSTGPAEEVFTVERLSEVYRHRMDVIAHPRLGHPLILPA